MGKQSSHNDISIRKIKLEPAQEYREKRENLSGDSPATSKPRLYAIHFLRKFGQR